MAKRRNGNGNGHGRHKPRARRGRVRVKGHCRRPPNVTITWGSKRYDLLPF
jgi:hypothetical protein